MDSMSLDSGEDSKADDMDEMAMPNPGSIQVVFDGDDDDKEDSKADYMDKVREALGCFQFFYYSTL